ncbi:MULTISPECIES: nitronate monooxygenase [unclassified Streptomyces]|uniref:nitronate monooxygenase n=1 Tax=unclassified Streptomyces TaxID=2593676 RepID=UPI0034340335
MHTALSDLLGVRHPIVGFNRSPAVVAEVTRAGGFGVLAATACTPEELDAQLTWIEEQVGGRPYGVDLLVPGKVATGDPQNLIASLRAQIPAEHIAFVENLMKKYDIPVSEESSAPYGDDLTSNLGPSGVPALLDVAFSHRISLIANALGTPPPELVERGKAAGEVVASPVGKAEQVRGQLAAEVDMLIAQGTGAGGHTGTIATMVLTPEIVDLAGDVPVLAAVGADTLRSPTRTGKPARQLRSAWHDEWERPDGPHPLPMPLQPLLVNDAWTRIDKTVQVGHEGALALETLFIGQVVGGFQELRSAADITQDMAADCEQRVKQLSGLLA